jgi:hypothetical protein
MHLPVISGREDRQRLKKLLHDKVQAAEGATVPFGVAAKWIGLPESLGWVAAMLVREMLLDEEFAADLGLGDVGVFYLKDSQQRSEAARWLRRRADDYQRAVRRLEKVL